MDRLHGAHFGLPKRGSKMPQAYIFLFFGRAFCLVVHFLYHGPGQDRKNMGAILQPFSAQILLDISVYASIMRTIDMVRISRGPFIHPYLRSIFEKSSLPPFWPFYITVVACSELSSILCVRR